LLLKALVHLVRFLARVDEIADVDAPADLDR
jgi:hypothetical protein